MTVSNPTPTVRLRWLVIVAVGLFSFTLLSSYPTFLLVALCCVVSFLSLPIIKYVFLQFIKLLNRSPAVAGSLLGLLLGFLAVVLNILGPLEVSHHSEVQTSRPYLQCQKYSLHLSFDPTNNTFKGTQEILLRGGIPLYPPSEGKSVMTSGITPIRRGEILIHRELKSPDERNVIINLLLSAGMDGWKVEDVDVAVKQKRGEDPAYAYDSDMPTVEVEALLSTDKAKVITKKEGLITYTSEVSIPSVVFEERLRPDTKVEILVTAPVDTYIKHNLNGAFSETVLENNKLGQKLIADKIVDRSNVIRFNYPSNIFQNRVSSNLLSFSWVWAVLLAALSTLTGILGYFCALVLDVVKDDTLKPMARRALRFFRLMPKE